MSGTTERKLTDTLLDALYPPDVACALCGRETLLGADRLCVDCRESLKTAPKLTSPSPVSGIVAAYRYEGGAREGIHALKYHNQARLAPFFTDAIDLPPGWRIDAVVPVPLHPLKKWLRSYNQSELLAASLCHRLNLTLRTDLLRRVRFTRSQTTLGEFERAKNVARAFVASLQTRGLNVLLIDDVTTTHSTLLACAVALKSAGAGDVFAACAAATGHDVDGTLQDMEHPN